MNKLAIAETSRLNVSYEEAGSGPNVIVLLHGNFGSSRWWRPVLERLPPGYRALAPVLRGCAGTANGAGARFEITELADDLFAFVSRLGIDRLHLVGHSLGGAVAMQFAIDHPAMVRSVSLLAPAPAGGLSAMRDGGAARLLRMFDPDHGPSMSLLQMSLRMHHAFGTKRMMLEDAIAETMPTVAPEGPLFESLLDDAVRMTPEAAVGFYKALHRWNVERELHRLVAPALVLAGGRDRLVPRASLEKTARLLPRGELVEWPHVGHSPMIEAPEETTRLIVEFCARESILMRIWTWLWLLSLRVASVTKRLARPSAA